MVCFRYVIWSALRSRDMMMMMMMMLIIIIIIITLENSNHSCRLSTTDKSVDYNVAVGWSGTVLLIQPATGIVTPSAGGKLANLDLRKMSECESENLWPCRLGMKPCTNFLNKETLNYDKCSDDDMKRAVK